MIILGDSAVHEILIGLSRDDILEFLEAFKKCLLDFSLDEERRYQPPPGVINRPNGQKTLFRPFTSPKSVGTKIIVHPAPEKKGGQAPLHGILALCDENGLPTGIINAEEVTGYRTSLSAIVPFMWRRHVQNVLIFGAGKQALWHTRLALALRGSEVENITITNRTEARARELMGTVQTENEERWKSKVKFKYCNQTSSGYQEELAGLLSEADVIFCTVPSTAPLFDAQLIINKNRQRGPPLITAIGSWQPDMIEVDPAILHHIIDDYQACHVNGKKGGMIIVDDREGSLEHAGEIVQAEIEIGSLVELGEILGLRKGQSVWNTQCTTEELTKWLSEGLVVYKSIGVSVTDLMAGNAILEQARRRGLGTEVADF